VPVAARRAAGRSAPLARSPGSAYLSAAAPGGATRRHRHGGRCYGHKSVRTIWPA